MSKASFGFTILNRVKNLVGTLISIANYEIEEIKGIKIKCFWDSEKFNNNYILNVANTTLKELANLVNSNINKDRDKINPEQIRESIKRMEDYLGILEDMRLLKVGSNQWFFKLKLCSKNKFEALLHLEKEWNNKQPPKSKIITKASKKTSLISAGIFPNSNHYKAKQYLKHELKTAQNIKLYSIGLNFLWDEECFRILKSRTLNDNNLQVKICLANVSSPELLLHFSHEGEHAIGVEGLKERIRTKFLALEKKVDKPSRFSIKLFDHYPTHAMFIFDKSIYVHIYPPINILGNYSPMFYWTDDSSSVSKFFTDQFDSIWEDSQLASQIYKTIETTNLRNCKVLKNDEYTVSICIT